MLNYIKGELTEVMQDCITLENNGIGYQINVPVSLLSGLPPIGREVKIYTYLYVREDALQLYGFFTRDDLQIFPAADRGQRHRAQGVRSAYCPISARMT